MLKLKIIVNTLSSLFSSKEVIFWCAKEFWSKRVLSVLCNRKSWTHNYFCLHLLSLSQMILNLFFRVFKVAPLAMGLKYLFVFTKLWCYFFLQKLKLWFYWLWVEEVYIFLFFFFLTTIDQRSTKWCSTSFFVLIVQMGNFCNLGLLALCTIDCFKVTVG